MTRPSTDRYYRSPIAKLPIFQPRIQPEFATVCCHGCGEEMQISIDPVRLWIGITYKVCYPCLEAPYLCKSCREDPRKLDKAHEAMEQHFSTCKRNDHE